ncbi:hypothetical protein EDD11_002718 [Mortierella claussenii]|nr:hypothetical protein EDD11_002718 [Mortierella claussenii]
MSHTRSKSTSSVSFDSPRSAQAATMSVDNSNRNNSTPLAISIPRQRSMSTSFGLATSPITLMGSSSISNSNPFLNPIVSPTSANSKHPAAGSFGTTPPTNLTGLPSSIPSSMGLNKRFSSSFTNPLSSHPLSAGNTAGIQTDYQQQSTRRSSLFGSSPPMSRNDNHAMSPPEHKATNAVNTGTGDTGGGGGGGGGGGIGGLFRKFSTSRQGAGATQQHPFDVNEAGPLPVAAQQPHVASAAHLSTIDTLKHQQPDRNSRPGSPMRNMILNGQMLD